MAFLLSGSTVRIQVHCDSGAPVCVHLCLICKVWPIGSERSPWKLVGWVLFSVGSNQRL